MSASRRAPPEGGPTVQPSRRSAPGEQELRRRIRAAIEESRGRLRSLASSGADQTATQRFIVDFLRDALGYDPEVHLRSHYLVQGVFVGWGITLGHRVMALVRPKTVGSELGPPDLWPIEAHMVAERVHTAVLTNGVRWQTYHLAAGPPIEIDLMGEIDLLDEADPVATVDHLLVLRAPSLRREPSMRDGRPPI